MKKIILLFTILISISLYSQEHMTFKGIEINGSTESLARKLINVGFKPNNPSNIINKGSTGEFLGEECTLYVLGEPNLANTIGLYIEKEYTNWTYLKNDYLNIIELYDKKYGSENTKKIVNFRYPYEEGDGHELTALKIGKLTYASFYYTELGSIMISISDDTRIMIAYTDKKNDEINKRKENNKIINEI